MSSLVLYAAQTFYLAEITWAYNSGLDPGRYFHRGEVVSGQLHLFGGGEKKVRRTTQVLDQAAKTWRPGMDLMRGLFIGCSARVSKEEVIILSAGGVCR